MLRNNYVSTEKKGGAKTIHSQDPGISVRAAHAARGAAHATWATHAARDARAARGGAIFNLFFWQIWQNGSTPGLLRKKTAPPVLAPLFYISEG